MDFSPDGVLYAAVNIVGDGLTGSDHLAILAPATGIATVIGPFGECPEHELCSIEGIEGIAFDPSGTLWGSHSTRGPAGLTGLYTINPESGQAIFMTAIDDGFGAPSGGVVSLQFDCAGTLFAGTATGIDASDDGFLGIIDPKTGLFTFVGDESATGGSSLAGLAFQKSCDPPDPKLLCGGFFATIVGTGKADVLIGTQGRDVIVGLGGNDIILGLKGDDRICGGRGNDIISGGPGNDHLFGQPGDDVLSGRGDDDRLVGGVGNDLLNGGHRDDNLFGNSGDDILMGRNGDGTINCGRGDDVADGGPEMDAATANCQTQVRIEFELIPIEIIP